MIGRFFEALVKSFLKNKILFWILFGSILSILIIGLTRLKVDRDIYSIFPKGKEFQEFSKVIQENNLNKQLVFSFKASQNEDENYDHLDSLSNKLQAIFSSEIGNLQVYRMIDQSILIDYLQSASIAFLKDEDYHKIPPKLTKQNIEKQLEDVKQRLSGANSVFIGSYFAKDPLNVLGNTMSQFNVQSDSSTYTVENGIVYSQDKSKVYFFADLLIDSKNNDSLKLFDTKLNDFKHQQNPSIQFDSFGVYQIALANAEQIQKDTTLTTIISVSLILLLLVIYYRSFLIPIFFLLPAAFGILSGLGMTGFINPEINAISIATASVLLGIVLDYAFHFYTHYKHSGDLLQTVREIGTPMIIGSFTTVAAFAALLFTESIVLKNFGLIALFTLLGAVLFTLLFQPVIIHLFGLKLKHNAEEKKSKPISKLAFRLIVLAVVAFTTFSLLKAQGLNFDGDLNNLSYHPQELKEQEKTFTGINPETQKRLYVFANGKTLEDAKIVSENLYEKLDGSKNELGIQELISPSPYLISAKRWNEQEKRWLDFWKSLPKSET